MQLVDPSVSLSLYFDSVTIFYFFWNTYTIDCELQVIVICLSHWALENGFSSAAKTHCVAFLHTFGVYILTPLSVSVIVVYTSLHLSGWYFSWQ
jgi:hypothetical protein